MKKFLKYFFSAWTIILIANQIFIFNGCFALYCIIAALPHTGVIAFILTGFIVKKEKDEQNSDEGPSKLKKDSLSSERISASTKIDDPYKENDDPLKKKGDQYEKHIGYNFEKKGDIVIYNGFINGYSDEGVDVIAVPQNYKSINLIQCKNWNRKSMELSHIENLYDKLNEFNFDYCIRYISDSTIYNHLQLNNIDKKSLINQLSHIRENHRTFVVRKTLYISSEKVVNLEVGKFLKMMKKNIFRYKDMKIVLVEEPE